MPSVTNFSFQCTIAKIKDTENLFLCGNFNGHIGSTPWAMKEFGEQNTDGKRILEFSVTNQLVICNSFFKKSVSLFTYESGGSSIPKWIIPRGLTHIF